MLRVYSVLYIERLWNDDATVPQHKHLADSSNSSVHSQIIVTDAYTSRDIQAEEETEHLEQAPLQEQASLQEQELLVDVTVPDEDVSVTDEDVAVVADNEDVAVVAIVADDEDVAVAVAIAIVAEVAHVAVDSQITENNSTLQDMETLDSKMDDASSVDSSVHQKNEHIISSLAIDTNNLQDYSAAQAKAQAETITTPAAEQTTTAPAAVTEKSADLPTSISSSSSILPPLTPSSMHSGNDMFEKPRTTSLIRRETQKFNDKRKSFTKKMKRVLTVKSDSKRKSV